MPNTPFDKSVAPDADIDLSLFSHIQNDPFLSGTFKLEGSTFSRTMGYFDRYCASLSKKIPEVVALQDKMHRLLEIEFTLDKIKTAKNPEPKLQGLSESIATDLVSTLKEGEYLSLPGGWLDSNGGHAMVYQFKRVAEGFEFYIHNAGAGIQYHEHQSALDRELHYPVQAYFIPEIKDVQKLAHFLRDLFIPMLPNCHKHGESGEKHVYEDVMAKLSYLEGQLISVKGQAEHALTAGQLSGTCAERVLHKMLNANYKTLAEYQRFIYPFKRFALDDFIRVLQRKNQLGDERTQAQIEHAINTMLRTLTIPQLLSPETIAAERAGLQKIRRLLQQARVKPKVNAERNMAPAVSLPVFAMEGIPATLAPRALASTVHPIVEARRLGMIKGGVSLLTEMNELLAACQRLNAHDQHSLMVEGLELIFASFPLPATADAFDRPLPFYQGIHKENQAEFYQLMASLQDMYLASCKSISSTAALPRMMANGLSVVSILDYVTHQLQLNQAGAPTFHGIEGRLLRNFFNGNCFNPYFATNHPLLDKRLKLIESLYTTFKDADLKSYYQSIIDSEPKLKQDLLARYKPPADHTSAFTLEATGHRELYWFTENFDELSLEAQYQPLTLKFNLQHQLELCHIKAIGTFWARGCYISMGKGRVSLRPYPGNQVEVSSLASDLLEGHHNQALLQHKYKLSADAPIQHALSVDYPEHGGREPGKNRCDNHIQLFPSKMATQGRLNPAEQLILSQRHVDKQEITCREFFHLRGSPQHQIKLTLDYFQQHITKLSDKACQVYLEANLFEPGLLAAELDKNPDCLQRIDQFIDAGLKHFADRGLSTETSIFFIRLAFLVNHYAARYQPHGSYKRLPQLLERLSSLLQIDKDNRSDIKQSLHQYYFLTAMASIKLNPAGISPIERDQALESLIPSYVYMNAKANHNAYVDTSARFDLECAKQEVQYLLAGANPQHIAKIVQNSLEALGLGVCERVAIENETFFTVEMKQGDTHSVYQVDMKQGLVFNSDSMAYIAVPLDILHHPVMRFLDSKQLEPCFISSDGLIVDMGGSDLRFIRQTLRHPYRVQKKYTVGGQSQWYELHDLSPEQKAGFGLNTTTITVPFPAILQERETLIWVNCEDPNKVLMTENHRPTYHCLQVKSGKWVAHQLDDGAVDNGFTLNEAKSFLAKAFERFEDPSFITMCQKDDVFQVNFGRYGLTLLTKKEATKLQSGLQDQTTSQKPLIRPAGTFSPSMGRREKSEGYLEKGTWVYRLANQPDCILVGDVTTLLPGAIGLVFENQTTHQRTCYLPVQPFIPQGGPSAHSEFYNLQQDRSANYPLNEVKKLTKTNAEMLLPWQYTASERLVCYPVGKDGQPRAETACDALYLCYVHLGSQHPEKAWAVLEDCAKRLGGLKGTVEELSLLLMIIKALPRIIDPTDSKSTISTPAYVACQLKALALFTDAFTPDQVIAFPAKTFDKKTPNGVYQQACWSELQEFHKTLNTTVFDLYSRAQTMQRHMEHPFCLKDAEKKSLLDYYHFHLPEPMPGQSKALGSLGYEWQLLGLKTIKKEYEAIRAQERVKGHLPMAYQQRLNDVDMFIRQQTKVHAHHTDLELVTIDLSIPPTMHFSWDRMRLEYQVYGWLYNIERAPKNASDMQTALEALTQDVSETELLLHFPCYYQWVINASESAEKTALLTFCRQHLIANRHTPLDQQHNQTTYLCNILYRIAHARDAFINDVQGEQKVSELLKKAHNLPAPNISIYQIVDKTTAVLAETRDIWASLNTAVPLMDRPMQAKPSALLTHFSIERLLSTCGFDGVFQTLCQQYKAQANILSDARPAGVDASASLHAVLSVAEMQAGSEQCRALQATKTIAVELLSNAATRQILQQGTQTFLSALDHERQSLLEKVLRLANKGPEDAARKRQRLLELEGSVRAPLDEQRLLALYFKADMANYALETGLSDRDVQELHTGLSHFIALSVRQQSLNRLLSQLKTAETSADASTLASMAHELLTHDRVNYQTDSVLALLQYHEGLLLRPQQMEAITRLLASPATQAPLIRPSGTSSPIRGEGKIEGGYLEEIKKIIMGGGKSKVILPVLARCKASGANLVVIEVPLALFETNCVDLSDTSGRLFNQKVYPFKFNRDSECTPASLNFLYAKLTDVMVSKDYVVTTGDAVQSLELKYLELLLQRPDDPKQAAIWAKQIEGLDRLVSLFRTRADVVMDEVHQALLLKKKLNFTLGERRAVSSIIINECIDLYQFFEQVPMDALGDAFAGKSLAHCLSQPQLITQDEQWQAAMTQLTHALLQHPASPLGQTLVRMDPPLSAGDQDALVCYLANQGQAIPVCVLHAPPKIRTLFALYKEQLSQLLPQTLKRKLNEHYGASKVRLKESIAIPYIANNVPSERSRFGNYLEAINYTIQMLMIDGFSPLLLKNYLGQLQAQARQELLNDPTLGNIDSTPTARGFHEQLIADELLKGERKGDDPVAMHLSQINLKDEAQLSALFDRLGKNKAMIRDVLKTSVLPQLHVEAQVLHSDAYNHVDSYRSCQGLTGTPSNSSTYHQHLNYDKTTAAATDGFILNRLIEKQTAIRPVTHTRYDMFLQELFAKVHPNDAVRVIIDICAAFKGIDNIDVARAIATYIQEHAAQFSTPTPLKYILFFNEKNVLCALDLNTDLNSKESQPILIGSSDPDIINTKLGCTPDARFSYYDQSHTVGVDLKQSQRAKAFVLVDHETQLQNFTQGCLRMRGLQDEQRVEIIVPNTNNVGLQVLEPLIQHMAANEERQLQRDNFTAAQAKMTNLVRADFMRRLLALPHDAVDKKHAYAQQFKDYFVELTSQDFFAIYGSLAVMRPTADILTEQRDRLIKDWSQILSLFEDEIIEPEPMRLQMDEIIHQALPQCLEQYLSPAQQEHGKEVEVQKQVQVELQRETQLEQELFNPLLKEQRHYNWNQSVLSDPYSAVSGIDSLRFLCRGYAPQVTDFGSLHVSRNYYRAYEGQREFIGAYLKAVHALLFRKRPDGTIDCLIVSQQDTEELTSIMQQVKHPDVWLCTTQHTLLAGRPPVNIIHDPAYQQLIEQARFFNGELSLLLNSGAPLNWLGKETEKKLSFFEQHLLPYREADHKDLLALKQVLSQRKAALQYIDQHPLYNYIGFEWRAHISDELTDEDIDECEKLARAYAYANAHWRDEDFNKKKYHEGLGLSLQASFFINDYIEKKLSVLHGLLPIQTNDEAAMSAVHEGGRSGPTKEPTEELDPLLLANKASGSSTLLVRKLLAKCSLEQRRRLVQDLFFSPDLDSDTLSVLLEHPNLAYLDVNGWLLVTTNPALVRQLAEKVNAVTYESIVLNLINQPALTPDMLNVLNDLIAGVRDPSPQLLKSLLTNDKLLSNPELIKRLLPKINGNYRDTALRDLFNVSAIQSDVLMLLIEDNQHNVDRLMDLLLDYGEHVKQEHLLAMIPTNEVSLFDSQKSTVATLLQYIFEHQSADNNVVQTGMRSALLLGLDRPFWMNLPDTTETMDLSDSDVIKKSPFVLKKVFRSIRHVIEIDLSNNQLGTHDHAQIADILASLPPGILKLDLSDNDIDDQDLPYILAAIPPSVSLIAYKDHDFRPREEINTMLPNYSLLFNCLAGVATVAGGILLAIGLYLVAPLIIGIGAGIVMVTAVGMGLAECGLFSNKNKPPKCSEALDDDFGVGLAT